MFLLCFELKEHLRSLSFSEKSSTLEAYTRRSRFESQEMLLIGCVTLSTLLYISELCLPVCRISMLASQSCLRIKCSNVKALVHAEGAHESEALPAFSTFICSHEQTGSWASVSGFCLVTPSRPGLVSDGHYSATFAPEGKAISVPLSQQKSNLSSRSSPHLIPDSSLVGPSSLQRWSKAALLIMDVRVDLLCL